MTNRTRPSTTSSLAARLAEIGESFQQAAASEYPAQIERAAAIIGDALASGHKLLAFGNGGSAADAQHLCGELVVRFQTDRRALAAIALVNDAAVLTACANDYSYREVFARQIEALGQAGDVAFAITTSGNSPNVIRALEVARERGLSTILLTGSNPGPARESCDLLLAAPGSNTARIQELHLAAYHLIAELMDARFS
jgi:D-sedoheptulose 7-phosphate isomerase